jgi:NAD(P)-dependent dehydrogenase (short-subunit alcohol dehydrogenase family)
MRLKDRVAIVVGAGQSPGEGIGNGRATALTFAREGAQVLCVDHNLASAQETVGMIGAKGGTAVAFKADVTKQAELKAMAEDAQRRWGRIDILHNNVGVSLSGGDAELLAITEEAFDRCVAINLKSCILAAKHVIPIMRQ